MPSYKEGWGIYPWSLNPVQSWSIPIHTKLKVISEWAGVLLGMVSKYAYKVLAENKGEATLKVGYFVCLPFRLQKPASFSGITM